MSGDLFWVAQPKQKKKFFQLKKKLFQKFFPTFFLTKFV